MYVCTSVLKINELHLPFTECCNASSTIGDIEEDDSTNTLAEDVTVISAEGGGRGAKVEKTMAGEEESGGLGELESGTAVSVVKGDVFEGDGSASSGGTEGVLSGEDGCAWGGDGSALVDDRDCGRGDNGASVLFNELM